MKTAKVLGDILKADFSAKSIKPISIAHLEDMGKVFVTANGFVGYWINEGEFKIDVNKLNNVRHLSGIANPIPKGNEIVVESVGEKEIESVGKKIKATCFGNPEKPICIDTKLLKDFDKEATFMADPTKPFAPLFVYENGELVGIVMPIKCIA